MTEELPFNKRDPVVHPCGPPTDTGVFGPVDFHSPLNQAVYHPREVQTGNYRPLAMKVNVRAIDSRKSQIERNRENLFYDSINPVRIVPSLPKSPVCYDRHSYTPHFDTYWISHPPENTSLAPHKTETFFSMSMQAPHTTLDHETKNRIKNSKYAEIRANQKHFNDICESLENAAVARDKASVLGIQAERTQYQNALEARHRIEKIPFFE